jgi:hypothetical protein
LGIPLTISGGHVTSDCSIRSAFAGTSAGRFKSLAITGGTFGLAVSTSGHYLIGLEVAQTNVSVMINPERFSSTGRIYGILYFQTSKRCAAFTTRAGPIRAMATMRERRSNGNYRKSTPRFLDAAAATR